MDKSNLNIAKNTLMLYIRMLVIMFANLYMSRIVLAGLGVDDFGTYGIVGGVVTFFLFIKTAVNSAISRFLSFEIGAGNSEKAENIFSLSITIQVVLALLIIFLGETVGLYFVNNFLVFPESRLSAANFAYQFSLFTAVVSFMQLPFNSLIISHEKMGVYAYISIFEAAAKLACAYAITISPWDKLKMYSAFLFIAAFCVFFLYRFFALRIAPNFRYRFFWDKKLFSELFGFSFWSLFGSVANIFNLQGVNVLMNMFLGVGVNAAMGIATQISNAIISFSYNFQTAFNPQIVKRFSAKNMEAMHTLVFIASKVSFFIVFILGLPVVVNTDFVLDLWLGKYPMYTVEFTQLMIMYSIITAFNGPLIIGIQATGQIKFYQIVFSIIFLSIIPIGYIILKAGLSPVWIFIAKIFINILITFWRVYYVGGKIKMRRILFVKDVILRISTVATISYSLAVYAKTLLGGFGGILLSSLVGLACVTFFAYFIGFSCGEREALKKALLPHILK